MTKFLQARWKAIMPFVAYGISEALKAGAPDLHTPAGIKAFVSAFVVAVMVYLVPNKTTA